MFSFRLQAAEQLAHDFGGLRVLALDQVTVNSQRDGGRAVAQPAANC
jgi:hypothetical protein